MTETAIKSTRMSADWLRAPALAKVFAALSAGGAESRVVGGAVRNAMIARPVKDIDIATTALPADVMRFAAEAGLGAYPTGIDHGTVTVVADKRSFEVTTLRRDVETDGRHAVVTFTTSWEEDAARRDFTINALYCSADGIVYDFAGGLDDLRQRRVRFIGDAEARIREDYLRILRFFRFSAEYGKGQLDPTGLAAANALKEGMSLLSAERVRAEILKLLAAPGAVDVVNAMSKCGIIQRVVKTRLEPDRFARFVAIETVLGEPPDALARLAALAVNNKEDAAFLSRELRLSNTEAERLSSASADNPGIDPATSEAVAQTALYKLGAGTFARAVRLAWARSAAPSTDPHWRARALLPDRWKIPTMPFSGSDVLALGVQPARESEKSLKPSKAGGCRKIFPTMPSDRAKCLKSWRAKLLLNKSLNFTSPLLMHPLRSLSGVHPLVSR